MRAAVSSIADRQARVRHLMNEEGYDALIVFAPADCRYLTGFTGEASSVILTSHDLAVVSDSRFIVQAADEIPTTRLLLSNDGRDEQARTFLMEALQDAGANPVIAVATEHLGVRRWERLRPLLEEGDHRHELVEGLVEKSRRTKFADELEAIREAGCLAAAALTYLESLPVVGRSERDVALDIEVFLRRNGSEGIPFPFIVAAGARGAMPHGEASDAIIEPGRLVVFDLGAVVRGYASDITRTYATGPIDDELAQAYELVRQAQEAARVAAAPGMPTKELDKVARDHLAEGGLGDLFLHSLGHGVGLEVHEAPFVSPRSEERLEEGMVITIEPGVYLAGRGGVRIEDTVAITRAGAEVLTECPRELRYLR